MSAASTPLIEWLWRCTLEGSLLIALVFGLRWAFRHHLGPRWRIALWTLVGLKLLVPASLTFLPGIGAWGLADSAPAAEPVAAATEVIAVPSASLDPIAVAPAALPPVEPALDWQPLVIGLWIAGAIAWLLVAGTRQARFSREVRRRPCRDARLLAEVRQLALQAGIGRRVHVVLTPAGSTPAMCGLWRPTLLLPEDWTSQLSGDRLRHVLTHELEHVRFGDILWNWIGAAITALQWFNPLAWLANAAFQSDRELRCDADTLSRLDPRDRLTYGHTLLDIQQTHHAAPAIAGLAPCVRHHPSLRQRLVMITRPTPRKSWLNLLLTLSVATLVAFSFGAAQADNEREGERPREGERDGDRPREGERDGDRPREGERDGDRPREGERDGDRPREGERDGDRPREGERDGDRPREGERDGDMRRDGERDRDRLGEIRMTVEPDGVVLGDRKYRSMPDFRAALSKMEGTSVLLTARGEVPMATVKAVIDAISDRGINDVTFAVADGRRDGPGDGERPHDGPRDGDMRREGPRDGDRPREGERDGDRPREGERDGDMRREGPRDGDRPREGERDGDRPREGERDGDRPREGERDGDRPREGERNQASRSDADDRQVAQWRRIYGAYDKNEDGGVSFDEWLSMKDGEMPRDRRDREQGWYNQADADRDGSITVDEWISWNANRGRSEG